MGIFAPLLNLIAKFIEKKGDGYFSMDGRIVTWFGTV